VLPPVPLLADLPSLRAVIRDHQLSARKALGQNFLTDANLLDRIARVPGDLAGQTVFEVGPGPGGLTRAVLRAGAARVVAVERDPRCLAALAPLVAAAEGRLTVIEADALTFDEPAALGPAGAHVIANLPYNIGTPLLVRWLNCAAWPPWWQSLTLMFQKEVALRITAPAGTAHYGRLAVLAQWRARARIAFEVSPRAFVPPPQVTSAVVHIQPGDPLAPLVPAVLERVTAAAFGQRRKMLRTALKSLSPSPEAWLESCGIDPTQRAETVSVAQFCALALALDQQKTDQQAGLP